MIAHPRRRLLGVRARIDRLVAEIDAAFEHRGPGLVFDREFDRPHRRRDAAHQHPPRGVALDQRDAAIDPPRATGGHDDRRSEEHTSELQSLMRISYAVFCLKKKNKTTPDTSAVDTHQHVQYNVHTPPLKEAQ